MNVALFKKLEIFVKVELAIMITHLAEVVKTWHKHVLIAHDSHLELLQRLFYGPDTVLMFE